MDNRSLQTTSGGGYYGSVNINILRMEKEPKPFSEDKAQEIMKAEGLEERSQEVQDAFDGGQDKILKMSEEEIKWRKEREEFANKFGLTEELRELYIERKIIYQRLFDRESFFPQEGVTEEQILKFIEKASEKGIEVGLYDVCGAKIISEKIIQLLIDKYPDVEFADLHHLDVSEGENGSRYWRHKIKEMGGKIVASQDPDLIQ